MGRSLLRAVVHACSVGLAHHLDGGRGLAEAARHKAGAALSTEVVHAACCQIHDAMRTALKRKLRLQQSHNLSN